MLDDMKKISEIDKSDMLGTVAKFPEQIKEAKDIVESASLSSFFKINNIVISGMGGSSITGDIVQTLFRDKIDIPIFVTRQYDLPKWVNKETLVISQSYSGNTEETLSTFKHAYQKRSKIIGISSGGKLQEYCEKREAPHIKIPTGFPPRAATGYILFSALYALKKIGIFHIDLDSEIKETISITDEFRNHNKKEIPEKTFYSLSSAVCPNMKKITLEKVLKSMESLEPKIELSEDIMQKAKVPLQKMMDIGRGD